MISSNQLKTYSNLIIKMLDRYSEETTAIATDLIDTDEKCIKAEELFQQYLSEGDFLKAVKTL